MASKIRAWADSFYKACWSFLWDHLSAIRHLFGWSVIEDIVHLLKRLFVVWPSFLSLLFGVLLLTLSQVVDLLARSFDALDVVILILFLMVFWIVPLHLGARILLDAELKKRGMALMARSRLDRWLPRDLAFVALLALFFSVHSETSTYTALSPRFAVYGLRAPSGGLWIVPLASLLAFLIYLTVREDAKTTMSAAVGRRISIAFTCISLVFLLIALSWPFELASLLGGLMFVPMLLGSWIMPLVGLIVIANTTLFWRRLVQIGTVMALAAFVFGAGYSGNHFHDLRVLPADKSTSGTSPELALADFVGAWKKANNCDKLTPPQRCPVRAVLVTAEGGASRAAFQVATVMGKLLDEQPAGFRNRLFLLSGVSGGSLGLATVRQALADSADGKPPCRVSDGRSTRNWLYYKSAHAAEAKSSWRKCLQLLVSADYLTPAFVGLALRDWWMAAPASLDLIHFADRSALLEEAMEQHYARITKTDCGKFEGLCARFGHGDRSKAWLPALLLNSTLVERGQNVVASEIDPSSQFPDRDSCVSNGSKAYPAHLPYSELIPDSYDIFELLGASDDPKVAPSKVGRDIRISTAIVTSARFPIISSQGNIRSRGGALVGQLVDGGYFDNSGLVSIFNIVDALDCYGIDSTVISIGNDPVDDNPARLWKFDGRKNIRHPPLEFTGPKIDAAFSPLNAFFNSRQGHVLDNRFETVNRVGFDDVIPINVYTAICVETLSADGACPAGARVPIQTLSMSWWLSSYVQLFIEMQDKDQIPNAKCDNVHCRYNPTKMLAADFDPSGGQTHGVDLKPFQLNSLDELQHFAP